MRFCPRLVVATVLMVACAFGQHSAPTSSPPPPSATPVSPPTVQAPIALKPDASGAVPPEQIRELLRRAEENDLENDKRQRDYTYIERVERHQLDDHGGVKKTETWTSEVLEVYGEQVVRQISKDDKPLPSGEAKKEEEKIQKIIDKRKNESDADRRKRLERDEKDREEDRKFVLEIADAFNFRLAGSEILDGHDTWMLDAEPRPGYEPKRAKPKCSVNSRVACGSIRPRRNG